MRWTSQTQARFARITTYGCRNDPKCDGIALSDVGLIAPPDWRFALPVDLADPVMGGHVVWAQTYGGTEVEENYFGGTWNDNLLLEGHADSIGAVREDRG